MTTAVLDAAPPPCGGEASHARYRRHLRAGEPTCPDCRRAHAAYVATFRPRWRDLCRRRAWPGDGDGAEVRHLDAALAGIAAPVTEQDQERRLRC